MIRNRLVVSSLGLLVVAVGSALGAPAHDGVFVASQTGRGLSHDETLTIHRITATGFEEVYQETGSARGFGWSDAHTLWVLHADTSGMAIAKLVDGKLIDTRPIPATAWKVPVDPDDLDAGLHVTTAGVWLEMRCPDCAATEWLRVDTSKFVASKTKPKLSEPSFAFAAGKAPAGYAVKLVTPPVKPATTHKGPHFRSAQTQALFDDRTSLVCNGPGGVSLTWPDAKTEGPALHPGAVTWVRTSPPLVRITGKRVQPTGDVTDGELFIAGCSDVLDDALSFGGAYWAALHDDPTGGDGTWTIYRDDKVVGSVTGSFVRIAPH